MSAVEPTGERIRTAEVVGALCLATDLGVGFPFEHGLHTTLFAMRLADRLGVDRETASQTYYASLLKHSSCTTDAEVASQIFGGSLATQFQPSRFGAPHQIVRGLLAALPDQGRSPAVRVTQVVRRLPPLLRIFRAHFNAECEVAATLAAELGLPESIVNLFEDLTERWDGKGPLRRARGDEIPLPMRITHVASDTALQRLVGGDEYAVEVIAARAGEGLDPRVAQCLVEEAGEVLRVGAAEPAWEAVMAYEPLPHRTLEGSEVDRALAAMGAFADLVSPHFTGHSKAVADLTANAAEQCRLESSSIIAMHRAALVHDLGCVAVSPRIWNKDGPLTTDEWEQVRLHPYHGERVLCRSPFLATLAPIAAAHHERLDRSGYHRGVVGAELPMPTRLLAAADVFRAMTETRPYRAAMPPAHAATELGRHASDGLLDGDAVAAVVEAAGLPAPAVERPAGLTARETEVVAMLARGLQTKQVARTLGISAKTADRHVQNAYAKIGVSSRAAATLFAVSHGLVAWGELPIDRAGVRP